MQYNYRSKCLVVIDGNVYVYNYGKRKFDKTFVSFQPKQIFIVKSKVCEMTEFFGANDSSDLDGNTILIKVEIMNTYILLDLKFLTSRFMLNL